MIGTWRFDSVSAWGRLLLHRVVIGLVLGAPIGCGPQSRVASGAEALDEPASSTGHASPSPAASADPETAQELSGMPLDAQGLPSGKVPRVKLHGELDDEDVAVHEVRVVIRATGRTDIEITGDTFAATLPLVYRVRDGLCVQRRFAGRDSVGHATRDGRRNQAYGYRARLRNLRDVRAFDPSKQPASFGKPQQVGKVSLELQVKFDNGWLAGTFEATVQQWGDPGEEQPCDEAALSPLSTPARGAKQIAGPVTDRVETFARPTIYQHSLATDRVRPGYVFIMENSRGTSTAIHFETPPAAGQCISRSASLLGDPGVLAGSPNWYELFFQSYEAPTESKEGSASGTVRFGWGTKLTKFAAGRFEDVPVKRREAGVVGVQRCAD